MFARNPGFNNHLFRYICSLTPCIYGNKLVLPSIFINTLRLVERLNDRTVNCHAVPL